MQADAFEKGVDKTDARINDGNQYKGLMDMKEYKAKRAMLAKDEDEVRKEKEDAVRAKIRADRAAKERADRDREDREKARREKLQRELSASKDEEEAPRKKKKKKAAPTLSFDAEEED